jgi:hypothetical protein
MSLQRYNEDELVTSSQNGLGDVLEWIGLLCAKEYAVELLYSRHRLPKIEAARRVDKIAPHVRVATAYVKQSLDGPSEISFLPAYYAILNLMKVCVLLGPRHADLPKNRTHGASYNPEGKESRSILTEEISLRPGGVFPLFYETLTGTHWPAKSRRLRVGDFLGCVSGVWYEYSHITARPQALCQLNYRVLASPNGVRVHCVAFPPAQGMPKGRVQALKTFSIDKTNSRSYLSRLLISTSPTTLGAALRATVKTHLLYRVEPTRTYACMVDSKLELAQELPIALLFFYMSCIVRYRPEYFARLRDSKYWSLISSARTHAFLEFLLCFWSFVQKRNFFINSAVFQTPAMLEQQFAYLQQLVWTGTLPPAIASNPSGAATQAAPSTPSSSIVASADPIR